MSNAFFLAPRASVLIEMVPPTHESALIKAKTEKLTPDEHATITNHIVSLENTGSNAQIMALYDKIKEDFWATTNGTPEHGNFVTFIQDLHRLSPRFVALLNERRSTTMTSIMPAVSIGGAPPPSP